MARDEEHAIFPEGESTELWAIRNPGFLGSTKQLTNCARCGELNLKRHDEPRHFCLTPTLHVICDDCYDTLPD